jgi:hypothetical protein
MVVTTVPVGNMHTWIRPAWDHMHDTVKTCTDRGDIESVSCCIVAGPVDHGAISSDTKLKPSASSSLAGPAGELGADGCIVYTAIALL